VARRGPDGLSCMPQIGRERPKVTASSRRFTHVIVTCPLLFSSLEATVLDLKCSRPYRLIRPGDSIRSNIVRVNKCSHENSTVNPAVQMA
jgi:hypothetical protein